MRSELCWRAQLGTDDELGPIRQGGVVCKSDACVVQATLP